MQNRRLTVLPSSMEITFGFCFLAFQVLFLGTAIVAAATALHAPIDNLTVNILYFLISLAAVLLIFRTFHRANFANFRRDAKRVLKTALIALPIYYAASLAVNGAIEVVVPDFFNRNDDTLARMLEENFALALFMCVVLAPIVEETLYRGMLFASLTEVSRPLAYGITILFFSMIHIVGYLTTMSALEVLLSALQYIPATIMFCVIYERTDCIWTPILLHAAANLISCTVIRFTGG